MEIIHHISFSNFSDSGNSILKSLNLKVKKSPLPGGRSLFSFDISETDNGWPKIQEMVTEYSALDIYDTFFDDGEIRDSEWNRLYPIYENGYPQPEKNHNWKRMIYEDQCPKCGLGFHQISPFHIKQEPKLGKNNFVSLYWTYTIFAQLYVLEIFTSNVIRGYEEWPAILHKSNQPAQTIKQIFVPIVTNPGLALKDKIQPETCSECGLTKYSFHKRGKLIYERKSINQDVDIQMTYEWFGSGRFGGFREFIISKKMSRLILDQKWQGIQLKPIELI